MDLWNAKSCIGDILTNPKYKYSDETQKQLQLICQRLNTAVHEEHADCNPHAAPGRDSELTVDEEDDKQNEMDEIQSFAANDPQETEPPQQQQHQQHVQQQQHEQKEQQFQLSHNFTVRVDAPMEPVIAMPPLEPDNDDNKQLLGVGNLDNLQRDLSEMSVSDRDVNSPSNTPNDAPPKQTPPTAPEEQQPPNDAPPNPPQQQFTS